MFYLVVECILLANLHMHGIVWMYIWIFQYQSIFSESKTFFRNEREYIEKVCICLNIFCTKRMKRSAMKFRTSIIWIVSSCYACKNVHSCLQANKLKSYSHIRLKLNQSFFITRRKVFLFFFYALNSTMLMVCIGHISSLL